MSRVRRLGERGLARGLVLAAVLATILVLSPSALGSPVGSVRHAAPFHGIRSIFLTHHVNGCNATSSAGASFNLTSGGAAVSVRSRAASCGLSNTDSNASAEDWLFLSPLKGLSSAHQIVVSWDVAWTLRLGGNGTIYPGWGYGLLSIAALVHDLTANTYYPVFGVPTWYFINDSRYGPINWHGASNISLFINETFLNGHSYSIETGIYAYVEAYSGTSPGVGSIDLATHGNRAVLRSVTVL